MGRWLNQQEVKSPSRMGGETSAELKTQSLPLGRWQQSLAAKAPLASQSSKDTLELAKKLVTAPIEAGKKILSNPIVKFILEAPEYPIGGFLRGIRKESDIRRGQGLKAVPPALLAGVKNIPQGFKDKTTIMDYLEKDVPEFPPWLKLAVGLPVSLAVPAVPIGKIAKATGVSKLASKAISKTKALEPLGEAVGPIGKYTTYRYGQPAEYAKLAEKSLQDIGVGTEKALELTKPIAELSP